MLSLQAQSNIYNNWYFGKRAAMTFNTNPPSAIADSDLYTDEGTASISDESGNILFYSNGEKVLNRNNVMMPNGNDLEGHRSSASSIVVVPQPGADSIYYLFTVDAVASNLNNHQGFNYSILDMRMDGGLGDITAKNIRLQDTCSEHLVVIPHANGQDFWAVAHGLGNNHWYSYLLNSEGVFGPVMSMVGDSIYFPSGVGQCQASPDGSRIALGAPRTTWFNFMQLYDFDNNTGQVSHQVNVVNTIDKCFYMEFSPNGQFLYRVDGNNRIYQHEVFDDYVGSGFLLTEGSVDQFGHLQLGPDGKIYISRFSYDQLGVIHSPNSMGTTCQLDLDGPKLAWNECYLGLPTNIGFNSSFTYKFDCNTWQVGFSLGGIEADSVSWNLGDGNYSKETEFYHYYDDPDTYQVTLHVFLGSDTLIYEKEVLVPEPITDIGFDVQFICPDDSLLVKAPKGYISYEWSDGSTADSIWLYNSGVYSLVVYNAVGCSASSIFRVNEGIEPQNILPGEVNLCHFVEIELCIVEAFDSVLWDTGEKELCIKVSEAGTYSVMVYTNQGCILTASTEVSVSAIPPLELPDSISVCPEEPYFFELFDYVSFDWSNGSSSSAVEFLESGTYYLTVLDVFGCASTDSLLVDVYDVQQVDLGNDTTLLVNDILELDAGPGYESYLWLDGSDAQKFSFLAEQVGVFNVYVVATDDMTCKARDTIEITVKEAVGFAESITEVSTLHTFPNPSQGLVNIEYSGEINEGFVIEIYDIYGRKYFVEILQREGKVFDITHLPAGIYWAILKDDQGRVKSSSSKICLL